MSANTGEDGQPLDLLQERLGYRFKDQAVLEKALTHSSYAFEQVAGHGLHNETLEFLGDAVLDLIVGFQLFTIFPDMREGDLTKSRAALVNETHLAAMARSLGLGDFLLLGKGEDASQGRSKASILACAFEAIAGAIFLDGGFEAAAGFVDQHFSPFIAGEGEALLFRDAKSHLQEVAQEKRGATPMYILEKAEGPDHCKRFTVSVRLGAAVLATGTGRSKKVAEQRAAAEALKGFLAASDTGLS